MFWEFEIDYPCLEVRANLARRKNTWVRVHQAKKVVG